MSENRKDFYVGMVVGAVIALLVIFLNPSGTDSLVWKLCDGSFVAAVMVLGFGGLVFARNHGAFDMMTYSLKTVFHLHFPWSKDPQKKDEDFIAYRERKAEERKPANGILLAGAVYLLMAFAMLGIYYLTLPA